MKAVIIAVMIAVMIAVEASEQVAKVKAEQANNNDQMIIR